MNIIKLKDEIMPADMPMAEYFNKYLKGKYAYWVRMRYIVSFEHMRHEGYIACEEDISKLLQKPDGSFPRPYGAPAIDIYEKDIMRYVDSVETDKINNIIEFRMKNSYSPDDDITIDELKLFRSWLAKELLKMDQNEFGNQNKIYFDDSETHILDYYANDMYNETIKALTEFGSSNPKLMTMKNNTCSCQDTNLSSLYNLNISSCEPINIYRNNIYNRMVLMYSNVSFWQQWPSEFINEFKKYIDNIIKCNFVLTQSPQFAGFVDCGCQSKSEQDRAIEILKKLSLSLGYIRDGKAQEYKNFINDTLYEWSSVLYEKMKW